jgi:hypothetical protein
MHEMHAASKEYISGCKAEAHTGTRSCRQLPCCAPTAQNLGTPKKIIQGFAPELFGKPVDDEDIFETDVKEHGGLTYYYCEWCMAAEGRCGWC